MAGSPDHRINVEQMDRPPSQLPVHLLMILAQLLSGVYYVVTSIALVGGMNRIVLSLYRDIVAMFFLVPAAYFVDKGNRVKLSWDVVLHLLVLGLTGIFGSNYLLFVGIEYTSPEMSAAVQPFIPVMTALISIVLGIEVVHWRRRDGQSKVLGILASCTGAIVMTFYQGPAIQTWWADVGQGVLTPCVPSIKEMSSTDIGTLQFQGWGITPWQFGGLCLIGNCACMAVFINLQAPLLKRFPAPVSVLAYSYGLGALCMAVAGYFTVTSPEDWALGWNADLATVLYNGAIASALNFAIMGWCLNRVGPLFVSSYIPLQPVIAGGLSLVFLGSTIYLGSIIGSVLVIVGLLLVSWSREETFRLAALARHLEGPDRDFHYTKTDALKEPLIQVGH